jgi:hypothetical protein
MPKTLLAAFLAAVLSPALGGPAQVVTDTTTRQNLPPDLMSPPATAVVIMSVENMFSGPTDGVDVVSQALLGDNVRVLKAEKDASGAAWVRIETPDTYRGWVRAAALRFLKPGDPPYAKTGQVFAVTGLMANLYAEPDVTAHKPLKIAPLSAVLEVAAEKNDRWLEIVLPCGHRAFVQRGDGILAPGPWSWPRRPAADMIALGKRLLGVPYLWGGTSPLGLDCSGFVQLVYRMNGVAILRDADIQMTESGLAEVAKGQAQAGDLVFFGRAIDKISHVGMMIDGENFINATVYETPCVRIDNLKVERWAKIYQACRRPR